MIAMSFAGLATLLTILTVRAVADAKTPCCTAPYEELPNETRSIPTNAQSRSLRWNSGIVCGPIEHGSKNCPQEATNLNLGIAAVSRAESKQTCSLGEGCGSSDPNAIIELWDSESGRATEATMTGELSTWRRPQPVLPSNGSNLAGVERSTLHSRNRVPLTHSLSSCCTETPSHH